MAVPKSPKEAGHAKMSPLKVNGPAKMSGLVKVDRFLKVEGLEKVDVLDSLGQNGRSFESDR